MTDQTARTRIDIRIAAAVVLLALAVLGPACRPSSSDAAVVAEKTEILRTYPFSDPDPVPIFARLFCVSNSSLPWRRCMNGWNKSVAVSILVAGATLIVPNAIALANMTARHARQ